MKKINRKKLLTYIACVCAGMAVISFVVVMLTRPENQNGEESVNSISDSDIAENHIYYEYSKLFIIDADITSTAPEKADVLYAKYYKPDEKKLWSAFFDAEIPKREVQDDGDVIYDDGKNYTLISESYIRGHRNPDYIYVKLATENFTTKYESWWSASNQILNPSFDTMYKKESLSFMSPEDAIERVCTVLNDLGIEVFKEGTEVYAIDHETMQEYQDKIVEENPYLTEVYGYFKEKFEEDDDFYILCFTTAQNQIPVTHANYVLPEIRTLSGSKVKIYLSEKGIFNFDLNGVYQVESVAEPDKKIITIEEAVEKACEAKFSGKDYGNKTTVDEIRFEYAPIPYNSNPDEVKLTPVWTLHMYEGKKEYTIYDTIMIDAITGEKIN